MSKTSFPSFLNHVQEVDLLHHYLDTNFYNIEKAKKIKDMKKLRKEVKETLEDEYDVKNEQVVEGIMHLFGDETAKAATTQMKPLVNGKVQWDIVFYQIRDEVMNYIRKEKDEKKQSKFVSNLLQTKYQVKNSKVTEETLTVARELLG